MITHEVVLRQSYSRVCGKAEAIVFGKPYNFRALLENPDLLGHLVFFTRKLGVSTLYLPNASGFNAKVAEFADQFPQKTTVDGVNVLSDCFVDGVKISKGQAFFIASGDCPTLIFSSPNKDYVIVCHAGRNSLIDVERIFHTGKIRTHQSVVDRALEFFKNDEKSVSVDFVCGIGPHHFEHSTRDLVNGLPNVHAERNKQLVKYIFGTWGGECFGALRLESYKNDADKELFRSIYPSCVEECIDGKINLFGLVREQAISRGVPGKQVFYDGVCTYTTGMASHRGKYWSNRRGDKERNGVLVVMK